MKLKKWGKWAVSTAVGCSLGSFVSAAENTAEIKESSSVAQSQRQVVMGFSDMGLETRQFSFPVTFCDDTKKKKSKFDSYMDAIKNPSMDNIKGAAEAATCGNPVPLFTWNVSISDEFANDVMLENYPFLISARYDRMVINDKQSVINTAAKDVTVPLSTLTSFSYDSGSLEDYEKRLLAYLNEVVAPNMTKILDESSHARFSEMSSKEAGTFMTTKAKDLGMDEDSYNALMNTGYAFGLYLPKVEGGATITKKKLSVLGVEAISYEVSLTAPLDTVALVMEWDSNIKQFKTYKIINSKSKSLADFAGKMASGMASSSRLTQPTKEQGQEVFDEVFKTSFKDSVMAINTRLKRDRRFAIQAAVQSVTGDTMVLPVGVQEDIKIDNPMKIVRIIEGEEKQIGFIKIRNSGMNCLRAPDSVKRTVTTAESIIGDNVEMADLAVEHAWTGAFLTGSSGVDTATYTIGENTEEYGAPMYLNLGFSGDLGYITNTSALSEVWLNIGVGAGFSSTNDDTLNSSSAIAMSIGGEKRHYVGSGVYLGYGVDFNLDTQSYSSKANEENTLKFTSVNVLPKFKAGYLASPDLEFFANVGVGVPLTNTAELDLGGITSDVEDVKRSVGLSLYVGMSYHMDFAGPFAKMAKKPSLECDQYKK